MVTSKQSSVNRLTDRHRRLADQNKKHLFGTETLIICTLVSLRYNFLQTQHNSDNYLQFTCSFTSFYHILKLDVCNMQDTSCKKYQDLKVLPSFIFLPKIIRLNMLPTIPKTQRQGIKTLSFQSSKFPICIFTMKICNICLLRN